MVKSTIILFLDLLVAAFVSKLIDTFWGFQPQITPVIVFVLAGGVLLAFFQNERELALTWAFHRFLFLINARDQYRRLLETKVGKNSSGLGGNSIESYLLIANDKQKGDFSSLCYKKIVNSKQRQKILILGDPGSGKSFGLIKTALAISQMSIYRLGLGLPIPILIRCDEYKGSLLDLIKSKMPSMSKGESGKILGKGADKLLRDGRFILLLDALDETSTEYKSALFGEIETWVTSNAYARCSLIITGRKSDIDEYFFEKLSFDYFEIKDLTDSGVIHFIDLYKQENQVSEDILETIKHNNLLDDRGLGRNPFWLSLMVEQNVFGADYVVILDQSVNKLLRKEFEKTKSSNRWERKLPVDAQIVETRLALSTLALEMVRDEKTVLEFDDAKVVIDRFIQNRNQDKLGSYDVVGLAQDSHILEMTRLVGGKQSPVRFRHPLLRDFMAACYILEEKIIETNSVLISQNLKQWWYVLFFSISLLKEASSPWADKTRYRKILELLIGKNSNPSIVIMIACTMNPIEKYFDEELYEGVLTRLEQVFNLGFSRELEGTILNVIGVAPEYFVDAINELYDRQKLNDYEAILDFMIRESIKTGHKSRLLIHLLEQHKMQDVIANRVAQVGDIATIPLVEILESEKEYSKWDQFEFESDEEKKEDRSAREWLTNSRKLVALSALVKVNPSKAVPYLEQMLKIVKPLEKSSVIKLIGEAGNPNSIKILLSELKKDKENHPFEQNIEGEIHKALAHMGDAGLQILLNSLAKCSNPVEIMLAELDDAIASYGTKATDGLRSQIKSRNHDTVNNALMVIKEIKDPALLPDLLMLLQSKELYVRDYVADTMAEFGEVAIPYLIQGLNNGDLIQKSINTSIVNGLVKVGKPAVPSLIVATERSEEDVVVSVVKALGKIKDYHAIPCLEKLFTTHENGEVIKEAGIALGRMRNEKTRKFLEKAYKNAKRWEQLTGSLTGLVAWGDRGIHDFALEKISNGDLIKGNKALDDMCRVYLAMGLTEIMDTDALPAIKEYNEKLIAENTELSIKYAGIVESCANTLEEILHPKKDPRIEELRLQNKKLDEKYKEIMGNN